MPPVFILIFFTACTANDEGDGVAQDLVPVISVDLPGHFIHRESHEIEIVYKRPTNCHWFLGFDIARSENEVVVGVVNRFDPGNENCRESGSLESSATLNFVAERDDFYIFRFWQGKTAANQDRFLTVEVPVNRPGH